MSFNWERWSTNERGSGGRRDIQPVILRGSPGPWWIGEMVVAGFDLVPDPYPFHEIGEKSLLLVGHDWISSIVPQLAKSIVSVVKAPAASWLA
jgi:hypothetical protein